MKIPVTYTFEDFLAADGPRTVDETKDLIDASQERAQDGQYGRYRRVTESNQVCIEGDRKTLAFYNADARSSFRNLIRKHSVSPDRSVATASPARSNEVDLLISQNQQLRAENAELKQLVGDLILRVSRKQR
jgi:hypothetical protein